MHPRKQCIAASTVSTSSLSTAVEEMKVRPRMPSSSEGGGASNHYRGVGVPVLGAHTHYRGWGCLYSLQVVMGAHTHYRGWVYPYSLQGVRGDHTGVPILNTGVGEVHTHYRTWGCVHTYYRTWECGVPVLTTERGGRVPILTTERGVGGGAHTHYRT